MHIYKPNLVHPDELQALPNVLLYRRKQSPRSNNKFAHVEDDMMRNIRECKRMLAEHDIKAERQDILVNVPVLKAVRNLALRDTERKLRISWSKWKEVVYHLREAERKRIELRKNRRSAAIGVVNESINAAMTNVVSKILASQASKEKTNREMNVQKLWSVQRA